MKHYANNHRSQAHLGHGKWKNALGCTLLLLGMLAFGVNNAWAQNEIPDALKLDKVFYPTDEMGHKGVLWLETFTTGKVEQVQTSIPTDIVLVLDKSWSMGNNNMDYNGTPITRLRALQMAVRGFIDQIYQDAVAHDCDHRIAVVGFSTNTNTQLLSTNSVVTGNINATNNNQFTTTRYIDALVSVKDYINTDRLGTGLTGSESNWNTGRIYSNTGMGTIMEDGLHAATGILNARSASGGGGAYFTVPGTDTQLPRNMVVVFFTDGYPGESNHSEANWWPTSNSANGSVVQHAENAVAQAAAIKSISITNPSGGDAAIPTVYSIGVTDGANPASNYTIQHGNQNGQASQNGNYWVTGTKCFNALLHFISSDFDKNITAWAANAQNANYGGALPNGAPVVNNGYYFAATNATELSNIFQTIGSASGGTNIQLGSNAVVQDVISASFKLPEGATINDIKVYAPMLRRERFSDYPDYPNVQRYQGMTRKNANSPWEYHFYDTISATTDPNPEIQNFEGRLVLDLETGHITDSTYENRLNSQGVVTIDPDDPKKIRFTNFDFKHYYCGPDIVNGDTVGYVGRKLVMIIPIEIEEGTWGDAIETNTDLSFVTPDNEIHWQFPIPGATVIGDVWTEIITKEPAGYSDDNINSPEDLAWFISRVNGRAGYLNDNNVASNTTISGKLTADIDMSAHNWVPIGAGYKCDNQGHYLDKNGNIAWGDQAHTYTIPTVNLAYEGVFDGNGHVITGLKNNATKYYKLAHAQDYQVLVYPGMFSNVKGNGTTTGVVKNVFVLGSDFRARNHDRDLETFIHFGIIADTLTGGTIYNCEAVGSISCNNDYELPDTHEIDYTQMGRDSEMIIGGLVGLNNGGTIHSSMAMAELIGYSMGGMVGEMRNSAVLANSFTNGVYNYLGTRDGFTWNQTADSQGLFRYCGGLVARNHDTEEGGTTTGTVKNCYVRFERDNYYGVETSTNSIKFGQFVGHNGSGTIQYCYYPYDNTINQIADAPTANPGVYYSYPTHPSSIRYARSNDNMVGGNLVNHHYTINNVSTTVPVWEDGTTMVDVLNQHRDGYAEWKRTTAGNYTTSLNGGNINSDFPVLNFTDFKCIASTDGIAVDYAKNLDQMLERHNTGNMNVNTALPYAENLGYHGTANHNYHVSQTVNKSQSDLLYGATINLYGNDSTSLSTSVNTLVYIDENISLLQGDASVIKAFTGQHIIDYGSTADPQSGNRWHNVSSSLQNSKFGWYYRNEAPVPFSWSDTNPCRLKTNAVNNDTELFPVDMASPNPFDFYCFYEPQYHWINFKRASDSHWHMDYYGDDTPENHANIAYDNEDHLVPGKGYLLALHTEYFDYSDDDNDEMHLWTPSEYNQPDRTLLQSMDTLNNGNLDIDVTYTAANEWTGLAGYNLLGNPYQSYLDFDAFITRNSGLWDTNDNFAQTYAVFDPNKGAKGSYVQYMKDASPGANTASQYIHMHQGFFIQTSKNTKAYFTNNMRVMNATSNFRGERPAYPLINFVLTDSKEESDLATLELDRPENDGAKKLRMGNPDGRIYFNYNDEHLAIYFRNSDKDYQSLCFAAEKDGNFTLSWNTANANFSSLTLIDNITGVKTDMLTHDHYTFQGRVSDYNTRFKIVFGAYTDVEEQEETLTENFAFFNGDNLIINGTGHLDVIDVLGRVIYTTELTDTQNTVGLPDNFKGMGVLRISNGNGVKVQKIIIK